MRIRDEIRKCVIFIAWKSPSDSEFKLCGTAFGVGILVDDGVFHYIVTARHVIDGIKKRNHDGCVYVRLNDPAGGAEYKSTILDWVTHPTDVFCDVAVLPAVFYGHDHDHLVYPTTHFATEAVVKAKQIGVGDELFFAGLFTRHPGKGRSIPIIRMGNIAAMPEEPVETKKMGSFHAYLAECRSIGGLSGHPCVAVIASICPYHETRQVGARWRRASAF